MGRARTFGAILAVTSMVLPLSIAVRAAGAADPQVTATPTTGLGWRTDVEVRVGGATPGARVRISECFDDDDGDADCIRLGTSRVTDAGKARHTVTVRRFVIGEEDGGDCWRERTTCWLTVNEEAPSFLVVGRVPLTFDPSTPPPPPPRVDVTPSTDLPGVRLVSVQVTGLLGDGRVQLQECAPADAGRRCIQLGSGVANPDGRFAAGVTVSRLVGGFPYDCATSATPCVLRVVHESGETDAPLGFDPDQPLPPQPVLVASPTTNLYTDDRIVAVGHGFTASNLVVVGVCVEGVTDTTHCDTGNIVFATPTDGSFIVSLAARPSIRTPDEGVVDCRTAPGRCVLTAVTFSNFEQTAVVPLTFSASDDPSLTMHDGIAPEGAREVRAEVTLSKPSAVPITIEYVTHHDSARPDADYVRKRARLVFLPGETRHVVRVSLVDDWRREPTERFRIDVEDADHVHVSVGSATMTVTDDD